MKLALENSDDLDWALGHSDGVSELRFSSRLLRNIGLEGLIEAMRQFPDLVKVRVADDYIRSEEEIGDYETSVKTMFPDIAFQWTYDLRIDGKHGR